MSNIFAKTDDNSLIWNITDALFQGAVSKNYNEIKELYPEASKLDIRKAYILLGKWEANFLNWCTKHQPEP